MPLGGRCTVGNHQRVEVEDADCGTNVCGGCVLECRHNGVCLNAKACLSVSRPDRRSVRFIKVDDEG